MRKQRGITGLETAIILIAFVIVASVFSFTILSVGVFSSERSKEAILGGVEDSQNTLAPKGGMVAESATVAGGAAGVVKIKFVVAKTGRGTGLDLAPRYIVDGSGTDPTLIPGASSSLVISYIDPNQHINDAVWTVEFLGGHNGDLVLDDGEQAEITVWLHEYTNGAPGTYAMGTAGDNYLTTRLQGNTRFSIQVSPGRGASMTLERQTPPALDSAMRLN